MNLNRSIEEKRSLRDTLFFETFPGQTNFWIELRCIHGYIIKNQNSSYIFEAISLLDKSNYLKVF